MKAAIVVAPGQAPVYGDFPEPSVQSGKILVRVTAASISHVTKGRASGTHYSSAGAFPFVVGVDGVGVGVGVAEDGRRVYFLLPEKPHGAMAERCVVDERRCFELPDGIDDDSAAAMAIPGMSSWAALVERAQLRRGETVLVNGASGASGRLAIRIARHLGAGRVVAAARRPESFDELRGLGADAIVSLSQEGEDLEAAFEREFRQGIDVVLDYLWGSSAEALLIAAAKGGPEAVPIRYVQIGSIAGARIELPSAVLRSSALQLMGSGIGSVPLPKLFDAIRGVLEAAPSARLAIATRTMPLAAVSDAWVASESGGPRIVLRP